MPSNQKLGYVGFNELAWFLLGHKSVIQKTGLEKDKHNNVCCSISGLIPSCFRWHQTTVAVLTEVKYKK